MKMSKSKILDGKKSFRRQLCIEKNTQEIIIRYLTVCKLLKFLMSHRLSLEWVSHSKTKTELTI